jgi:uncharacterized Tic20 family protein
MLPTTKDDRTWAMLCHIAGLAGFIIPLGGIFGPLIVWMIKKDQSWFVDDQGKEATNFQISLAIYVIVSCILILVLVGIVLLPLIAIGGLILMIIAAIKANEGVAYRYPLTIRFLK